MHAKWELSVTEYMNREEPKIEESKRMLRLRDNLDGRLAKVVI